jgi:glycosyltransferase involved in cell wall biosynthesis
MRHICIDARLFGINHTGIGRYVENLIKYLPSENGTKVTLIISPENENSPVLEKYSKVVAKYHPYAIPSQFEMLYIWWKTRPDLLHATHSSIPALWPGKIVVTFHDLIRHISRGKETTTQKYFLYWIKYLGYLAVDVIAIYRSVKIIVPSNFWKEIIIKKFRISETKIIVTYEGVDSNILQAKIGKPVYVSDLPYVVYTGTIYPHKNIPILLEAIKLLKGKYKLVLVGARSVFTERTQDLIKKYSISDSVTLLEKLSDDQLVSLYSRALVFVFPSLIEGFGLPGLEAMSVGLPVIAANASCLPEIYQDSVLYFDPNSSDELSKQIEKIDKDKNLRKILVKKGLNQAKKYSWDKMAKQTWQIYQNALH